MEVIQDLVEHYDVKLLLWNKCLSICDNKAALFILFLAELLYCGWRNVDSEVRVYPYGRYRRRRIPSPQPTSLAACQRELPVGF